MNASTLATIRKFKTSDGAFIWQPGIAAGQPDTLLGYPVVEAEDMGVSLDALLPHVVHLIDEGAGLRVQLLNGGMDISERTGSPLDIDAPYFWLGGEFIRFGNCQALGGGIYRLSRLQRACFQSDGTVPFHPASERFVLIEPSSARLIDERLFVPGDTAMVEALGLADKVPASASATVQGLAIKPLAPVHGTLDVDADGSVTARWVRRSRIDLGWRDSVDQVMAEQQEQYLISVAADNIVVGEYLSSENSITFTAVTWSELGIAANAVATADIRQVGRHAQSGPLIIRR